MKFAICDDTLEDRERIEAHLLEYAAKTGAAFELSHYESGESLLTALKKTSFKVIFLDIYMLALNGIDTAREIRRFDKEVQIIFITTSPDHAVSSYDVRALHYIMKPVSYSKIEKVLNLCQIETVKTSRQIQVLTGKIMVDIKLVELMYAEMFNKVLTMHTTYGTIETRTSMENFEILLGGEPFLRCHRSFIVNMDFIEEAADEVFVLSDGTNVPISRPARSLSLKTYHEFVFSSMRKKLC